MGKFDLLVEQHTVVPSLQDQVTDLLYCNWSLSAALVDKDEQIAQLQAQLLAVTSVASALNHINRYEASYPVQ